MEKHLFHVLRLYMKGIPEPVEVLFLDEEELTESLTKIQESRDHKLPEFLCFTSPGMGLYYVDATEISYMSTVYEYR